MTAANFMCLFQERKGQFMKWSGIPTHKNSVLSMDVSMFLTLTHNIIIDYLSLCMLKAGYTSLSACLSIIIPYPVPSLMRI